MKRLLYRLYLSTMRLEGMGMLPVRRWILNRLLGTNLKQLDVHAHVFIEGWWNLKLGERVTINRGCHLAAHGGLSIGDDCMLAPNAQVWTTAHGQELDQPMRDQPISFHPVKIGTNCWLGTGAIVLGDVSLAEGTIVGAGAVVTKPFTEPYTTIAGNPAKVIRRRG